MTTRPSLLISGRRVSPSRLVPSLQLSEYARFGALSEAYGAGVVPGELLTAAPSARLQSHHRFSLPCQVQAAGTPRRRACSSRGELCGETPPWGVGRVLFLRHLDISSTPAQASQ